MELPKAQEIASIIPLDFTHVFYDSEDKLSLAMAVFSLVPQLLLVVYSTQLFSRREAETCLMFGGQIFSELANEYCKNIFKQERPRYGNGYGMPSAHAQFMAFYATYLIAWMFRVSHFSFHKKILRSLGLLCLSSIVAYSRVYLFYHTPLQVAAGAGIGVVLGVFWLEVVTLVRALGIVDLLLNTPPARFFYIKDTAAEKASFVRDEYVEWRRTRSKMKLLMKAE